MEKKKEKRKEEAITTSHGESNLFQPQEPSHVSSSSKATKKQKTEGGRTYTSTSRLQEQGGGRTYISTPRVGGYLPIQQREKKKEQKDATKVGEKDGSTEEIKKREKGPGREENDLEKKEQERKLKKTKENEEREKEAKKKEAFERETRKNEAMETMDKELKAAGEKKGNEKGKEKREEEKRKEERKKREKATLEAKKKEEAEREHQKKNQEKEVEKKNNSEVQKKSEVKKRSEVKKAVEKNRKREKEKNAIVEKSGKTAPVDQKSTPGLGEKSGELVLIIRDPKPKVADPSLKKRNPSSGDRLSLPGFAGGNGNFIFTITGGLVSLDSTCWHFRLNGFYRVFLGVSFH